MSTKGRTRSDTAADNSSTGPRPTNKRKAKQPVVCPICDESIVDATSHTSGQAAIFCEGLCKEWLHRQCAGLSKAAFDFASQSQDPFFCPQCRLDIQSRELSTLKAAIATLNEELTAVKNQLSNSQPSPSTTTPSSSFTTSNQADSKAASEIPRDIPLQPQHIQQQGTYPQVQYSRQPDKKFNVVIYGIEECPKGTPKHERFNRDLENIMTVISSVDTDSSIQPQSIRDHFRLGKFKNSSQTQQCRPRPILVRFIRSADVSHILSRRRSLQQPFSIKPDMSPKERSRDSTLMKERWSLIQSGTDRKYIRIHNSCIYVHNKLHGQINNITGEFQRALPSTPPLPASPTHTCITSNINTSPNLNPEPASHRQSSD